MTYTVRAFAYDAAPHHSNDLLKDTVDSFKEAVRLAKQRTQETPHNTGFAMVVDNGIFGKMGDTGVVASFVKTKSGVVRRRYLRETYRRLLWREKFTSEGLLALFNPELKLWEYFAYSGPGGANLRQTGSSIEYQHA